MRTVRMVALLAVTVTACSTWGMRGPMQRAIDPSMELLTSTVAYVRDVAGITGDATRMIRGDGYLYMVDVGPMLHHLASTRDSVRYRQLRRSVEASTLIRDSVGSPPRRRVRGKSPFEPASPYAVRRLREALMLGWQFFGDTASAALVASLPSVELTGASGVAPDQVVQRCTMAEESGRVDPLLARRVLASAKSFPSAAAIQVSSIDLRGGDGDLVALACLTRLGLALKNPDATVRFLDRLLKRLEPYTQGSGRPDPGAAADVLLTLRDAQAAGPKFRTGR